MSDSEYSSDDDEDYVPEEDSASDEGDIQEKEGNNESKTVKKNKAPKRKRKGGIKLEDDEDSNDNDQSDDDDDEFEEQERIAKEQKKKEEEEKSKKAHMEDLWASFKSDTSHVRAKPINQSPSTSTKAVPSKAESTSLKDSKQLKPEVLPTKPSASKVTITKTFDFAGEAVIVTKTVDAGSDEAKKAQKQQQDENKKLPPSTSSASSLPGVKRKGGLGNLIGQLGKKPKMSTLEKSKLDWDNFKSETGIAEDLKNFNKNGFLEKQDFLQRTDERLFEREKETRAAMRKQFNS